MSVKFPLCCMAVGEPVVLSLLTDVIFTYKLFCLSALDEFISTTCNQKALKVTIKNKDRYYSDVSYRNGNLRDLENGNKLALYNSSMDD